MDENRKDDLKDELSLLKQNYATLMETVKKMVTKDQLLQKRVMQLEEENLEFKNYVKNLCKEFMEKSEAIDALKKEIKVLKGKCSQQQTSGVDTTGHSRPHGSLKNVGVHALITRMEEIEDIRRKFQPQGNPMYWESAQSSTNSGCKDSNGDDCKGHDCKGRESDDSDGLFF